MLMDSAEADLINERIIGRVVAGYSVVDLKSIAKYVWYTWRDNDIGRQQPGAAY